MRFKGRLIIESLSYLTVEYFNVEILIRMLLYFLIMIFEMVIDYVAIDNKLQTFIEISKDAIFEEYRIESKANNQILFEIDLNLFDGALRSGKNAPHVDLKLVKRDKVACLCVKQVM